MRKLTAALTVVGVFATLLPASAGAANTPKLTHPTGTTLAATAKLKATNVGSVKFTTAAGAVWVECTTATMTGVLTKNTGNAVEIDVEKATLTSADLQCGGQEGTTVVTNVGNGTPWCIFSGETGFTDDEFKIDGGNCNEKARSMTFELDTVKAGVCKYTRATETTPVTGIYLTDTPVNSNSDAILQVSASKFTKEEGGLLCQSELFLDMNLTLETNAGTAEPLYFS